MEYRWFREILKKTFGGELKTFLMAITAAIIAAMIANFYPEVPLWLVVLASVGGAGTLHLMFFLFVLVRTLIQMWKEAKNPLPPPTDGGDFVLYGGNSRGRE